MHISGSVAKQIIVLNKMPIADLIPFCRKGGEFECHTLLKTQ